MRFLGRRLEVGGFEVLGESLAEGGLPVGKAVAVGLGEQLAAPGRPCWGRTPGGRAPDDYVSAFPPRLPGPPV